MNEEKNIEKGSRYEGKEGQTAAAQKTHASGNRSDAKAHGRATGNAEIRPRRRTRRKAEEAKKIEGRKAEQRQFLIGESERLRGLAAVV